jgi:hypothetical protein
LPAIPMVFSPSDYIDNRIKYTWGGDRLGFILPVSNIKCPSLLETICPV